jgi:hypothetical protein
MNPPTFKEFQGRRMIEDLRIPYGPSLALYKNEASTHSVDLMVDTDADGSTWLTFIPDDRTLLDFLCGQLSLGDMVGKSSSHHTIEVRSAGTATTRQIQLDRIPAYIKDDDRVHNYTNRDHLRHLFRRLADEVSGRIFMAQLTAEQLAAEESDAATPDRIKPKI